MLRKKVKLSVECSPEERTLIKILAAKNNLTISEFLLNPVRDILPTNAQPNQETIEALEEARGPVLKAAKRFNNLDDFWAEMGIHPNA